MGTGLMKGCHYNFPPRDISHSGPNFCAAIWGVRATRQGSSVSLARVQGPAAEHQREAGKAANTHEQSHPVCTIIECSSRGMGETQQMSKEYVEQSSRAAAHASFVRPLPELTAVKRGGAVAAGLGAAAGGLAPAAHPQDSSADVYPPPFTHTAADHHHHQSHHLLPSISTPRVRCCLPRLLLAPPHGLHHALARVVGHRHGGVRVQPRLGHALEGDKQVVLSAGVECVVGGAECVWGRGKEERGSKRQSSNTRGVAQQEARGGATPGCWCRCTAGAASWWRRGSGGAPQSASTHASISHTALPPCTCAPCPPTPHPPTPASPAPLPDAPKDLDTAGALTGMWSAHIRPASRGKAASAG